MKTRNFVESARVILFVTLVLVFGGTVNTNASVDFTGPYEMQNWSSSGISQGTTSISPSSGPATSAEFSYAVNIYPAVSGVPYRTTTFSATAAVTGYVSFDWTYTFLHSWYDVYADFYVFADGSSGTTSIHEVDFYNLLYTGYQTFSGSSTIWVEEGYDFGFTIGGSNYDYSGLLNGTLTVSNFIAPSEIVEIDIKPGSYPNSINPNAGGVIPVAILTTDIFDATTVNPETVALEGAGARGKGKSGRYGSIEDVDGDGDLDLVVQVVNEINWAPDATEATLTGMTWDGIPIEGTDSVNIVPPE